ncbi:MAG: LytR C-terminal domain-containing protein, partial [Phenylobacterium sp.]
AEGRALAPDSPVLASNLAYSAALEQRAEAHADAEPAQAVVALAPVIATPRPLIGTPGAIRLAYVQQAQLPVVLPVLSGRPLQIVNASGAAGAQQVVVRLASLGWSTPRAVARAPQLRARTEISYPDRSVRVARALANTLPPGVRLVSCAAACSAIRLTIGADSLAWRPPSRRPASNRGD